MSRLAGSVGSIMASVAFQFWPGSASVSLQSATIAGGKSVRAVDDLLRVPDRGLVRGFVFLQDVDGLLRRSNGLFLVAKLRLDLCLFIVHEVGARVLR